jgi:hypothetical protein
LTHTAAVIVIIPVGNPRARRHFSETVDRLWTVDKILGLGVSLPGEVVEALRGAGRFAVWGGTPRTQGVGRFFERLERAGGGVAAFYRDGRVVCWGRVFAWVRSRELAERLWGRDEEGQTWEYVYFIGDLRCCRPGIPWDAVRRELGYHGGFVPRGHTFVDPRRLEGIVKKYGDALRFFESLAEKSGACPEGSGEKKVEALAQRYNPYLIQSLKRLEPVELLEVIGRVSVKLAKRRGEDLSKEEVAGLAAEALREAGLERHVNYAWGKVFVAV